MAENTADSTLPPSLAYRLDGEVAVITLDDGKANVLSHAVLDGLHAALDRSEREARAVLIVGRPGRFSAGFDLSVMTASVEAMRGLVTAGAELLMRVYDHPLPTVAACTGHALAGGALLLLASDHRVGALGEFKIGLSEVSIGMALPIFAVELARDRLVSPRAFQEATLQARIHDPASAAQVGYLDTAVEGEALLQTAIADARKLGSLKTGAYAASKHNLRREMISHVRATLADDIVQLTGPTA